MSEDPRLRTVYNLIRDYLAIPSPQYLREPEPILKLSHTILGALDGSAGPWRKWPPAREALIRSATDCWIPLEDFHEALNELPGPPLTASDVKARLLALWEEYCDRPDDSLKEGCEALYAEEKAAGTELAAITLIIRDWMGEECGRRYRVEQAEKDRLKAEAQQLAEETFLSGADCKWTQFGTAPALFCRVNGRMYRLDRVPDRMVEVQRVQSMEETAGRYIGRYKGRPDATKAIAYIAYQPEPRR